MLFSFCRLAFRFYSENSIVDCIKDAFHCELEVSKIKPLLIVMVQSRILVRVTEGGSARINAFKFKNPVSDEIWNSLTVAILNEFNTPLERVCFFSNFPNELEIQL